MILTPSEIGVLIQGAGILLRLGVEFLLPLLAVGSA